MLNFCKNISDVTRISGIPKKRFYYQLGLISSIAFSEAIFIFLLIPFFEFFNQIEPQGPFESSKPTLILAHGLSYLGVDLTIYVVAICLTFAACVREVLSGLNHYTMQQLIGNIERGIKNTVVRATLNSTFLSTMSLGSGKFSELCNVCSLESAKVAQNVLQIFTVMITLLSYFLALLYASPTIALIGCSIALMSAKLLSYTIAKARAAGEKVVSGRANLSQTFFELHNKFREVKVNSQESFIENKVEKGAKYVFEQALNAVSAGIAFRSILSIILFVSSIYLILVLRASGLLDIAMLAAGLAMVMRLLPLVLGFTRLRQSYAGKYPYLNRTLVYLDKQRSNEENCSGSLDFGGLNDSLQFKGVEFRYPNVDKQTLRSINLKIEKGQSVAIVGASGAGKSTLVDLVPMLILPTRGTVTLDGVPIGNYSLKSLRKKIAYLSQAPMLYDGTIRENVTGFDIDVDEERVKQLVSDVGLGDFVGQLPQGLNTAIGNSGMKVSGGQTQRLAIARALYKRADIFIFDEPTSALDTENAKRVMSLVSDLFRKMRATVILISHNWDAVSNLDHMVKLENGLIVYQGKPDKKIMDCDSAIVENTRETRKSR